ncbi:MAG: hypothetical protein JSS55_13965 [Proteobacteria bacterium]|nr:hypothetical protein [Pseudomonadota bacterium]
MNPRLAFLLPLVVLGACDRKEHKASVEITSANGSTVINAEPGKDSRLKIDTPGVKADIKVPFMGMIAGNMDIDGVKLYPDSKILGVNINATDNDDDRNDGRFTMRFQAPADRAKVADWFTKQFADNDFKMTLSGSRFTGTNDEGKPVTLDMRDGANGTTEGEIRIEGK